MENKTETFTITKTYTLKLYPNKIQQETLMQISGCCRFLWNYLLDLEIKTYEKSKQQSVDKKGNFLFRYDLQALLPKLKQQDEYKWLNICPANTLQKVCAYLDHAIKQSFSKNNNKKGFPKFKSKYFSKRSFYISNQLFSIKNNNRLSLTRMNKVNDNKYENGILKYKTGNLFDTDRQKDNFKIQGATVVYDGKHWWMKISAKMESEYKQQNRFTENNISTINNTMSIDLGLTNLLTCYYGDTQQTEFIKAPKFYRKKLKKLKRVQQILSRKKEKSNRRKKIIERLKTLHRDVKNCRDNFIHNITKKLTDKYSNIIIEDLSIKNMSQNHKLAMSIADASWGDMIRQLEYKATYKQGNVVYIDKFAATTQTCCRCGNVYKGENKLTLKDRVYVCCKCGHKEDRDANAAKNIFALGLKNINVNLLKNKEHEGIMFDSIVERNEIMELCRGDDYLQNSLNENVVNDLSKRCSV